MFKGNRLSVRNLTVVFSLLSSFLFCNGIAFGQGGGEPGDPPFYGWKLESISYHGEDVLNVWKRNQAYQIVPVTYTRDWAEGQWRENGQLIGNAEFVLPFSNEWATQMTISSSSEGYTVHRFKYYPAPGQTIPKRASFKILANASGVSSGHVSVDNGFGDVQTNAGPWWVESSGSHLVEKAVSPSGEAEVKTPTRRAFATHSGYTAYVGAETSATVWADPRRASIDHINYRSVLDGEQEVYVFTSKLNGTQVQFPYPRRIAVLNEVQDDSSLFNTAKYIIGVDVEKRTLINQLFSRPNDEMPWESRFYANPAQRSPFVFGFTANATLEESSVGNDTYGYPSTAEYVRNGQQLVGWDSSTRYPFSLLKKDSLIERYQEAYEIQGLGILGYSGLRLEEVSDASMLDSISLKYRWASDGTVAESRRQLLLRPNRHLAEEKQFFDNGLPTMPLPLSGWVDGSVNEVTVGGIDASYEFISGSARILLGIIPGSDTLGAIFTLLGHGVSAANAFDAFQSATFNRETGRLYQGDGLAVGPAGWEQYENPPRSDWQNIIEHFDWRVYYVPEDLVTLKQFDMYSLSGFTGQAVVEQIEHRDKRVCQRQFRFWHKLGSGRPR